MTSIVKRLAIALGFAIWVIVSFVAAQLIVGLVFSLLINAGLISNLLESATLNTVVAALTYVLTLVIAVGGPWIGRHVTSLADLGLQRLPQWRDILLVPAGIVVYLVITALFAYLAGNINGYDATQSQDIGFNNLAQNFEYVLAFATLVVMAPLAEEALFRGYLFSKIRRRIGFIVTMLLTSLTFAVLHLPGFNEAGALQLQWNVALDVFALALVLAGLREYTGSIWASVLLHITKNGVAFYLLFINTELLRTMGM